MARSAMVVGEVEQRVFRARAGVASRGSSVPLAVSGALLCAAAVAMATASAPGDAAFGRGLLELLIVGVPIAVGLYALRAPINASFGFALLGIGYAWSLTALTESSVSVLFTIGRLSTWLIFPCVVYLLLAFPDGRIAGRFDRALLTFTIVLLVVLFLGTAPLVQAFPAKTLWGTCTAECPENAVFLLDAQPGWLIDVIYVREWLVEALWLGLLWSMFRRWRAASPLQRRAMGPAFVAATLLALSHYAHITARQLGVAADTVIALSSLWTFCIVLVCAGFLGGLIWRRTLLAQALSGLEIALHSSTDRRAVRDATSRAMRDPTAQLLVGETLPPLAPDQATTADSVEGLTLIHDRALLDDRELLDGVLRVLVAALHRERLTSALGAATTELQDSRRRIAEAADLERVRIERDLHDGAQQRLIALRIRLGVAEDLLRTDPAVGVQAIRELGSEAEAALDELRAVAHGVYPSLLTDRGISEALRSLAAHAPVPIHVRAHGVTRHPIEIESAVYFSCVEAMQNALKHAHGATGVWITLTQSRTWLSCEIRDDGAGFTTGEADGRGLRNMRDRIEAIGGSLVIDSEPTHGTRVTCTVPLH
ncbi:signal transduction histidine kinase [Solirubrobacter pauli]|uniref:histidine kinase n=1 Tax=Solirubrobacter pauli TaxID=166793 RepID=A0A660LJ61_9ACTN|nr:histidine kinase [Solirubrobacter pauli]RKQ93041.1 signal transduction histidine kinase [Solirubrobacter pauli]